MPLELIAGAPLPAPNIVTVPMDGWNGAVGADMLRTTGVADCLMMLMHRPGTINRGAMAHLSFLAGINYRGNGPANQGHTVTLLNNTVRVRDAMVAHLLCDPNEIEVYLWRGVGFGAANIPDACSIIDNLPWRHFGLVVDMMAHGDYGAPNDSMPFVGRYACSYVPDRHQAWFH